MKANQKRTLKKPLVVHIPITVEVEYDDEINEDLITVESQEKIDAFKLKCLEFKKEMGL